MSLDPVRIADTRGWLAKAAQDLRSATVDLAAEPPIPGDALFHCQQAVEKALKGLLAWHDQPFRKTHDLVELGGQGVALDSDLEPLLREAAPLTEYAWKYRYPGDAPEPSPGEAQIALDLASRVVEAIVTRVPEAARPDS